MAKTDPQALRRLLTVTDPLLPWQEGTAGSANVVHFDMDGEVEALKKGLRGLALGSCFCEVATGNPNYRGRHTAACLRAAILVRGEEKA